MELGRDSLSLSLDYSSISSNFMHEMVKSFQCRKCAFPLPVRKCIENEAALENWCNYVADGVMNNSIAEVRGRDFSCLRVADGECGEGMRFVSAREEFPLEGIKVVAEVLLEVENILLLCLACTGVKEGVVEIVVVTDFGEEIAVCFQYINMSPRNESHSKTVGRLVVGVDVPAVVAVDVVVAASQQTAP